MRETILKMLEELDQMPIDTWVSKHRTVFLLRAPRLLNLFEAQVQEIQQYSSYARRVYNKHEVSRGFYRGPTEAQIERSNAEAAARSATKTAQAIERLKYWLQGILDHKLYEDDLTKPDAISVQSQISVGTNNVQKSEHN